MKAWFNGLSEREQRLVMIAAAAVLGMLVYLLIWQPIQQKRSSAQSYLDSVQADLSWMQANAAAVQQYQRSGTSQQVVARPKGQSLLSLVDSSARSAGVTENIRRIQPSANKGVLVQLQDIAFDSLLIWLDQLRRQAVVVETFKVDQQPASGRVNANLILVDG